MMPPLADHKAPFPAFGGKTRAAPMVWARFGDVRNYVEPFCFSAAMLLKRPAEWCGEGRIETINDRNHYVANFWRAVSEDPEAVAAHADWPVSEVDLHARHAWLVDSDLAIARLQRVREDPEYFDAKIAGWWCWGACCWIGAGWCDETHRNSTSETRPDLEGQMVTVADGKLPHIGDRSAFGRLVVAGSSLHEQLPDLSGDGGAAGRGVAASAGHKRVKLTGTGIGMGVHANPRRWDEDARRMTANEDGLGRGVTREHLKKKRPRTSSGPSGWMPGVLGAGGIVEGACAERRAWITGWMFRLADRLRAVRRCCGHWSRVCDSPSTTTRLGLTGVFLDPPYRRTLGDGSKNRTAHIYANDRVQDVDALCDEVQAYSIERGADPLMRIALCGLDGEYPELDKLVGPAGGGGWEKVAWKSNGGYGNRTGENPNAERERIWFSPGCLKPGPRMTQAEMFGGEV